MEEVGVWKEMEREVMGVEEMRVGVEMEVGVMRMGEMKEGKVGVET